MYHSQFLSYFITCMYTIYCEQRWTWSSRSPESCFRKVVNNTSLRVVDRMDELSVDDGRRGSLKDCMIVETARVVGYGRWYILLSTLFVSSIKHKHKYCLHYHTLLQGHHVPVVYTSESISSVTLRQALSSILPKHESLLMNYGSTTPAFCHF